MSEAMRTAASLYNDPRYYSKSEVRIRNNKKRREKIFRRQLILLALSVAFMIFLIAFIFTSFMSDAQSDEYCPEYKYYKTVSVHADDTIWDIARVDYSSDHYDNMSAYISEICSINNIGDPNKINAGEALIVPYYSTEFK